jgi:acyl-CoA synthetase (AMP-forming)/AMP-acid ligase II
MWLTEILERNCQQRPEQPAVIDGDRQLTWRQLRQRSHRLAALLAVRGIGGGDRFGVLSRNRLEVLESYFAGSWLGAAFVPINHALTAAEIADVVQRVGIGQLLGEAELLARTGLPESQLLGFDDTGYQAAVADATSAPPAPGAQSYDDPMAILLTSATTGRPKAVVQTHAAMRHMSLAWLSMVGHGDRTVLLNLNPLSHGSIQVTINYLAAGATVVLLREFSPQQVAREIERSRVSHVWMVPQMLRFLLQTRVLGEVDLGSLREVMHGAAPISASLLRQATDRLPCPLRNVYGMTEAGGPFATVSTADLRLDADDWPSGRAIPGVRLRLLDPAGEPVPLGEVGEVCVGGPGLMREYWGDPVATAEVMTGGWLRTGDLGRLDEEGFVRLVDRRNDTLIRGGQNVYPAEIERCLLERPEIVDAAVIGVPDEDWGETPVAYLVLREPAAGGPEALAQIRRDLRSRLASYKLPTAYHLVAQIPRSGAGKALKRRLREQYLAARSEREDSGRTG